MKHSVSSLLSLALVALLAACSGQPPLPGQKLGKPYEVDGTTYYPEYDPTYDKTGSASWYGPGFHGKYTANGEVFNQDDLTAAHPTLPMPSIVRVTNLENGRSKLIRINDRGPFKDRRIIDLSRRSAQELGVKSLAKVRVQFLKKETELYLASARAGNPMSMVAMNERVEEIKEASIMQSTAPGDQIVESTIATNDSTQPIADSAPLMTVTSRELDSPTANPIENQPLPPSRSRSLDNVKKVSLIRDALADENPPVAASPAAKEDAPKFGDEIQDPYPQEKISTAAEKPASKAAKPSAPAATPSGHYVIQAGSFSSEENANKLAAKLSGAGHIGIDKVTVAGKTWWRVRVGPFKGKADADTALEAVRTNVPDARIIQL